MDARPGPLAGHPEDPPHLGLLPLSGVFTEVSGHGTVAADGAVSGVLAVGAASIDTKNARRDTHLRSADFFDVGNHRDITFTLTGAPPAADGARLTGTLTVRDQSRPAALDVTVAAADAIRAFVAKEITGDSVTMDVGEVIGHPGGVVVRARFDGTYDKSGLPEELVLTSYFPLGGGAAGQAVP